jgi:putative ABC transport system ATP-binding protein
MIKLENISKEFLHGQNKIEALHGISFEVLNNQFVVLKGISGSGKSTLISILAGLSKPSDGKLEIDGKNIAKLPDDFLSKFRNEKIGLIFQKFHLFDELTLLENIILPLYPQNLTTLEVLKKANYFLQMYNLSDKKQIAVKKLSGGEQQRVAIIRALIVDAPIILADEPTANLDKNLSMQFLQDMKNLKKEGKTIIIASHDPIFFEQDCVDKYIELQNGELV